MPRPIYAPTPMQEGMLFHSLSHPRGGVSVEQLVIDLTEPIDADGLRDAWERTVTRHAALRARFFWDEAGRSWQEIVPTVSVPWDEYDERSLRAPEQAHSFASFLRRDRERGFDLGRAPLLRLTLHRLGAANYRLTWTFHHALLDGRSYPALLQEVFATYAETTGVKAAALAEPADYRDYLGWRASKNYTAAERFWRQTLHGFKALTSLPYDRLDGPARIQAVGTQRDQDRRLTATATTTLHAFAHKQADHGIRVFHVHHGSDFTADLGGKRSSFRAG